MNERNFSHVESTLRTKGGEGQNRHGLLTDILGAIQRNEFGAIAAQLTEDAELEISGFGPMDGAWRGRDAVVAAIAANFEKVTEQTSEVEAMVQEGDAIVVLIREQGRWKADGKPYRVRGVIWWTFTGDRLARVEEFLRATD